MENSASKDNTHLKRTIKHVTYFPKGTRKYDFLYFLQNVGIAELLTKTLLAPIERYRIIKQTWPSFATSRKPFPTFYNFLERTWKEESFIKYWHGNGPNCFLYIVQLIAQFASFQNINEYWNWATTSPYEKAALNFMKVLTASSLTLLFTYPIETVKVRFCMEFYKKKQWDNFQSTIDGVLCIRKLNGIKGLYKGLPLGILNSTLYFYLYYSLYNNLSLENFPLGLGSASIPSLLTTLAVYPLDTIKHRLQLNNMGLGVLHLNTRHIIRQISKDESWKALYNGVTPTAVKHVLAVNTALILILTKEKDGWNYF